MDTKILTREIEIAGKKIPVWFIGAAGVVAAFALVTAGKNRTAQLAPPGNDPAPVAQTNNDKAKQTDLENTLNGFASQLQDSQSQLTGALAAQQKAQADYQAQLGAAQGNFQKQIADALAAQRDDFALQLASVRDVASRQQVAAASSIGGQNWDAPNYAAMQNPAPANTSRLPSLQAVAKASPSRDEKAFQSYRAGERAQFGTATTGARSALDLQRAGERGAQAGAYTVVGGDTLSAIAKRNNTTVAALMAKNSHIADANKIRVGQTINL